MRKETVILIAEDDAGHFRLVKRNLWRMCVYNDILHFRDGDEVLDFLLERGSGLKRTHGTPYLLLLDIRMPKTDGIEVLREVKADAELRKIPIIILTTSDDAEDVKRCYEMGCSFYIVKPSDYNDFLSCVETLGAFLSLPNIEVPRVGTRKTESLLK